MDPEAQRRLANLQGIIKWSMRQIGDEPSPNPGTSSFKPMDDETKKWLQEALSAISDTPSETDLLKASLAVLKAHRIPAESGSLSQDEKQALLTAANDTLYFIEDLDHANDLIPLGGVEVISSLVDHPDSECRRAACELIGTACQNNPKTQSAFLPSLPSLFKIARNEEEEGDTRVKAFFAISCLVRENEVTTTRFFEADGVGLLCLCVRSKVDKLRMKSLFLLRSITHPLLQSKSSSWHAEVVEAVAEVIKKSGQGEVREMATSTLTGLARSSPRIAVLCKADNALKEVLKKRTKELTHEDDELEHCRRLLDVLL